MEGLKSPGEGWRNMRFSDGTFAWISPKIRDDQWGQIKAQKEAELDAQYMAQAKAENRPITTVDKTYSATVARPNTPYGHLMGWIDHNLGGNALNANPTTQTVNAAVRPAMGPAMRISTAAIERNPYVGAVDLGLTGTNVAKHVAAKVYPGLNQVPDFPTILSEVRSLTGTPELDPNASATQRVLENAASIAVGNPGSRARATSNFFGRLPPSATGPGSVALDALGRAGASYIGGEAGEELAGEPGQFVGSFGGGAPGSGRALFQRVMAPAFRGRNTQSVSEAADRQGIQPTMGSVSNIMGRLVEKGLAATPFVGSAVRSAQDRFNDAIRQRQLEVGEDVFGSPLPGNISDESIGKSLIRGARQGSANITQRAKDEQNQLIKGTPAQPATATTPAQPAQPGIGANTGVQGRSVYYDPTVGYSGARLRIGPNEFPAYRARLDNIRQAAIDAQTPFFQQFWGQLANGEIPYERFQRLRSSLGADIEGFSGMDKGDQKLLYGAMTDAMRDAAFQRGGQALVDKFDNANANYEALIGAGGQRESLKRLAASRNPAAGSSSWGREARLNPRSASTSPEARARVKPRLGSIRTCARPRTLRHSPTRPSCPTNSGGKSSASGWRPVD